MEGKNIAIIAGVGIIALLLGVVGGGILFPSQSGDVIVIRFMGWGAGETEVQNYENMIGNFTRDNPNVIIKYEVVTNALHENVLASFGAGVAPDIFYMDSAWAPVFMENNVLYPINDLATDEELAVYYDFLLEPFKDSSGNVYGIPKDWSMLNLFYNKDLLSQAGWTSPPDTWAELRQCAIDITTATGIPGLSLYDGNFNRFVSVATSNGAPGPWFDSAADASWFDNTAVKDSLDYYINLFLDGKKAKADASEDQWLVLPGDIDAGWLGDAFGSGGVGMSITGSWTIPFLDGEFSDFVYGTDWDLAPLPKGSSGRSTMAYTVALGINKDTENPEVAWKFMQYMLNLEGQTQLVVKEGQTLPSIKGLDTHEDMWQQHTDELAFAYDTTTVFVWGAKGSSLEGDFGTIMTAAMVGDITVTEAISSMKTAVVDAYA